MSACKFNSFKFVPHHKGMKGFLDCIKPCQSFYIKAAVSIAFLYLAITQLFLLYCFEVVMFFLNRVHF